MTTSDGSTAADILNAALCHMQDRAATYDKPEGERSIGATVDAFTAVTGVFMTEEQGWLFMALLKAVRSQQGAYRADSYEDGAAYFALAGEAAVRDRNCDTGQVIDPADVEFSINADVMLDLTKGNGKGELVIVEPASAIDDSSERMQAIGQNGNGGEHYGAPDWSKAPNWAMWLAQDEDGEWYWFEKHPDIGNCEWWAADDESEIMSAGSGGKSDNWKAVLHSRPAN